jgi:DNA-binding NarL/FixJ family response regulator
MTTVYIADACPDDTLAFSILFQDLKMNVVGHSSEWNTILNDIPHVCPDLLLVDWSLINSSPEFTMPNLRSVCPESTVIVLISSLDSRELAAIAAGADVFMSKGETPDRLARRLQTLSDDISYRRLFGVI